MKTTKTHKTIALVVGVAVTALAIFAGEFSSHGETIHHTDMVLDIDENALIERAIDEMSEDDFAIEEESVLKRIKIFDKENSLVESIYLRGNEEIEDVYKERFLNQAEFLSSYGNTLIYRVSE